MCGKDLKIYSFERINGEERPTSLPVGVGVDFANQEAALVKFTIDLLGDADQRVPSRAQTLHGVGGGVCPDSVAHLRLHLLFIALEDHTGKKQ